MKNVFVTYKRFFFYYIQHQKTEKSMSPKVGKFRM